MANAFTGGVGTGGLHNTDEIKVLVMYIIKQAGSPFTMQNITNAATAGELANYFEVTNAVSRLENEGLIVCNDDKYTLTEKGKTALERLTNLLNIYAREEAQRQAKREAIMSRRLRENSVDIITEEGGYAVKISMLQGSREIMGVTLHVKTRDEANKVKENFYNDPSGVYAANIRLLYDVETGEKDV